MCYKGDCGWVVKLNAESTIIYSRQKKGNAVSTKSLFFIYLYNYSKKLIHYIHIHCFGYSFLSDMYAH